MIDINKIERDGSKQCSELIAAMYFKSDTQKAIELTGFSEVLNRRKEVYTEIFKLRDE